MKKILFFALLLAGGMGCAQAQNPEKKATVNTVANGAKAEKAAEIKFESMTHDYGTIKADEPAKCVFVFTNTGDAPLVIHQAIATCGCTVPTYSKDPVKPGEKGQIEVNYTGRAGSGRFMKGITVRSNAKTNPAIRLTVQGEVGN
ncbi:MAG: DUF1573 domain-containing protein [Bacteroidales bacterium]|nr:DUF1573 domain-containing protein [Bacteroidales bacterium]